MLLRATICVRKPEDDFGGGRLSLSIFMWVGRRNSKSPRGFLSLQTRLGICGGQKSSNPWELELQTVVSWRVGLGISSCFFVRTSALKHRTISPRAPSLILLQRFIELAIVRVCLSTLGLSWTYCEIVTLVKARAKAFMEVSRGRRPASLRPS